LPDKGSVLDAGCGTGDPIAKYFIELGYSVTGIDYSRSMIELARERFPHADWLVTDMTQLDLETTFDGIIGWHSFFHLTPDQQRNTMKCFVAHLKPKGALMLTVGTQEGEVAGHVCGEEVYHSSLSPEEYRQILNNLGLEIVDFVFEDPECDYATVLLARNRAEIGS
jgi:SAM-dependent methyltransferase